MNAPSLDSELFKIPIYWTLNFQGMADSRCTVFFDFFFLMNELQKLPQIQ